MPATREQYIAAARAYLGVKFSHQGRNKQNGMDCGGLAMVSARDLDVSALEFLGYASFPTDGKFDALLEDHTDSLWEREFPFHFNGDELKPADLLSFDYGDG